MTFHRRGIASSVSVISSPSFDSLAEPQHGQEVDAGTTTRSRGRCAGNGFFAGRWRSKAHHRLRPGRGFLGRQLVLGGRRLQIVQLHLELVEQPRLPLRAAAVELTPQLLDLQRQMGDQRLCAGGLRLHPGGLGPDGGGMAFGHIGTLLGRRKRGLQGGDILR